MTDVYRLIEQMEKRIEELPIGYISKKTNRDKIQYYLQWREGGKVKSKYIREEELETLQKQIEERKALQEQVKKLRKQYPKELVVDDGYETNVILGDDLKDFVEQVKGLQKRDLCEQLEKYIYGTDRTRVCVVYGLRRTGKTTMLMQAISEMNEDDFSKSVYMKLRVTDKMQNVSRDLKKLKRAGYKYIFMDEVTLMEDFIDSAALFSDIFVAMGMKIVLSGTDSLGFWIAEGNELYDRVRMIHTTYIPYREYSRLLGINSIDEYIRYGGTLRLGELNFDDDELTSGDASFRDDESTRKYIDTAISKNIQHSLACYEFGRNFGHLHDLYDADELTGAINRIIEDMNHRFVVSVLTRDFKSSDLGSAANILRNERDEEKRTDILEYVDRREIAKGLMKILDIRNKEHQTVEITQSHAVMIKGYLKALDLIVDCPVEHGEPGLERAEYSLFSQPGMRYCQAQALVHLLMKDVVFARITDREKALVTGRVLEEVRGRMMEDIILLEASKALGKGYKVFKLQFARGEYDMVIRNEKEDTCAVYEIKHSNKYVREQGRHLMNEEMLALTTPRFGTLTGRYVLYLGEDMVSEDGIVYRNAEAFLKALPYVDMGNALREEATEKADTMMYPVM